MLSTQCSHCTKQLFKEVRTIKKYVAPEAELVLLDAPNVMLEMSDDTSLFVDVFDKNN